MANFDSLNKKYSRPSLIIFSDTEPTQNSLNLSQWKWEDGTKKLYLTDDGRAPMQINFERIETKKRMIDGTMRSVHIADKRTFETSWTNLPSRKLNGSESITSDGFGAGIDLKEWYEDNPDDFWMLMVYDNSANTDHSVSANAESVHVFFNNFDFTIEKRGQFNDLWNVSLSLVEV